MDTVLAGLVEVARLTDVVGVKDWTADDVTVDMAEVEPEADAETEVTEVLRDVVTDTDTVVDVGRVVDAVVVDICELVVVSVVVVAAAAEVTAIGKGANDSTVVSVELCPEPMPTTFSQIALPPPVATHPT